MVGDNDRTERRRQGPMLIGEPEPAPTADRPRIQSDGRFAGPAQSPPPDPRTVIDDLRRQLRAEQEKSLNSIDAVLGARAAAAQAKAETQEVFYRLHVRETELEQLKELLGPGERPSGDEDGQATNSSNPVAPTDQPLPAPTAALRTLVASIRAAIAAR